MLLLLQVVEGYLWCRVYEILPFGPMLFVFSGWVFLDQALLVLVWECVGHLARIACMVVAV
jgi:hypothetical protein